MALEFAVAQCWHHSTSMALEFAVAQCWTTTSMVLEFAVAQCWHHTTSMALEFAVAQCWHHNTVMALEFAVAQCWHQHQHGTRICCGTMWAPQHGVALHPSPGASYRLRGCQQTSAVTSHRLAG